MIKSVSPTETFLGWMDSLADPTRLRLLRLIECHELGVAELCDVLQLPQSTVSRHLKLLADHGWVNCRRHGTANLYHSTVGELEPIARRLWLLARRQIQQWAAVAQDELRLARRLEQRQDSCESFFAGAARQWDQLRSQLYGQSFETDALVALLGSDWTVADLGCGTGRLTARLAMGVRRVIGVDRSAAMLKAARRCTAGLANVQLRRGDLAAVPIDDASCDAALLVLALTYVSSPARAVHEAVRILRPGGKVVVIDLLGHDRQSFRRQMGQRCLGFDTKVMEGLLAQAGLADCRVRSLTPESGAKGPALILAAASRGDRAAPKTTSCVGAKPVGH